MEWPYFPLLKDCYCVHWDHLVFHPSKSNFCCTSAVSPVLVCHLPKSRLWLGWCDHMSSARIVIRTPQLSWSAESQLLPRSYNRWVLSSRANITVFCLRFLWGIQNEFLPLTKTGSSIVSTLGIAAWLVSKQRSWSDAVALAVAFAMIVHTKVTCRDVATLFPRLAFYSLHVKHRKT